MRPSKFRYDFYAPIRFDTPPIPTDEVFHRDRIHTLGPGRRSRVSANMPVLTLAALVGCLGVAAGPAYAKFDIPTGAPPSPLFSARPFTQQMLRFEEFGTQPMPTADCTGPTCTSLPEPADCESPPDPTALDAFLRQPLHPLPTREANPCLSRLGADAPENPAFSGHGEKRLVGSQSLSDSGVCVVP
jgi:hypothetical protein